MGFWYILMFIIGIVFILTGALKKDVSFSVKIVILLFVIGILFVFSSLLLLLPGSSNIISELLK